FADPVEAPVIREIFKREHEDRAGFRAGSGSSGHEDDTYENPPQHTSDYTWVELLCESRSIFGRSMNLGSGPISGTWSAISARSIPATTISWSAPSATFTNSARCRRISS